MKDCILSATVCIDATPVSKIAETLAAAKEFAKHHTPADLLSAFLSAEIYHGGEIYGTIIACELEAFPISKDFAASVNMAVCNCCDFYRVNFMVEFSESGGGCDIVTDSLLFDVERYTRDL